MIEFRNVTKIYDGHAAPALEGLDLTIEKGEFVFIMGDSGAGKTTLTKLLLREEKPTSGKVLVDGRNLGKLGFFRLPYYRRKIGVVFQDSVLDGPLTVKDSFKSSLPEFLSVSDKLINGTVAAQLAAALLAVSCVTVTFCVNLTMIQDKANGARKDFNVSPTGKPVIYLGYLYCLAVCFRASCVIR